MISDTNDRNKVSVPFTSGSSLQLRPSRSSAFCIMFQFPLHRDPRCNALQMRETTCCFWVSVPFTSGSSLQLMWLTPVAIAATFQFPLHRDPRCNLFDASYPSWASRFVSVPFTSGSSLQLGVILHSSHQSSVSVPFTSGSSLQRLVQARSCTIRRFQFPLHRDPRCNSMSRTLAVLQACFSSLYIGILAATDLFLRFHTSLYWYFTMNTKRKPVGIFE